MGALRRPMQKKESATGLQNPDRRQARNPAFHAGCAHQAAQYKTTHGSLVPAGSHRDIALEARVRSGT